MGRDGSKFMGNPGRDNSRGGGANSFWEEKKGDFFHRADTFSVEKGGHEKFSSYRIKILLTRIIILVQTADYNTGLGGGSFLWCLYDETYKIHKRWLIWVLVSFWYGLFKKRGRNFFLEEVFSGGKQGGWHNLWKKKIGGRKIPKTRPGYPIDFGSSLCRHRHRVILFWHVRYETPQSESSTG